MLDMENGPPWMMRGVESGGFCIEGYLSPFSAALGSVTGRAERTPVCSAPEPSPYPIL